MNSKKFTPQDFELNEIEFALIQFTNALYDNETLNKVSKEEMRDLLSSGQILSKKWLLQELHPIVKKFYSENFKVAVVGGWLGFLSAALVNSHDKVTVTSYDIDPVSTHVAGKVFDNSSPTAILSDMYKIDYAQYDCVINTSTEHIKDISEWSDLIPAGKLVIAQGNGQKSIKDHISCVESSEELAKKLKLTEILFSGELVFPFYTRFMVIGKK